MRRSSAWLCAGVAVLAGLAIATPLLAKHPTNAGPVDAPIRFSLPPPPPLNPREELKTFAIQGDFELQLVAAEPLVEDPIAVSFDERGHAWVVEMRGYMHDVDGGGESQPTGRIKILEDTKGDGVFDKATIFMDHLVLPRAVLPVRGGALVGEPPDLWFARDADHKTLVVSNYGIRGGQPEHMANSPLYALDNDVDNANYPGRFRFQGGKWIEEADRSRGQWGLSQDDFGRLFFNYNSDLLRCDLVPAHYVMRNPSWAGSAAVNVQIMHDQRVWPSHPTPGVNRGYEKNALRGNGTLRTVTATCAPWVYRGNLFSGEYRGNVFICEPAGNLVKRVLLSDDRGSIAAKNAYEGVDFLTSTDERFRPVNLTSGPDGALYVVDMYRGVIEHERYLTNYLIKNIEARKLETPIHRGRIWRIVPRGSHPLAFKMPTDTGKLIACLANPDGWVRDTAQRLLVERHDWDSASPLQRIGSHGPTPLARLHALWTLEGMNRMEMPTALAALNDADGHVRAAAVRLCEPYLIPATRPQVLPALLNLAGDRDPAVRLQLLLTLSAVQDPKADDALTGMLASNSVLEPRLARDAALSGLRGREIDFLAGLLAHPQWASPSPNAKDLLASLAQCVWTEHRPSKVQRLVQLAAGQTDPQFLWRQIALLNGIVHPLKATGVRRAPKLIYLESKPRGLASLLQSDDARLRSLAERMDSHLAWPGKPGVPPPPVIVPLTPPQQARFERGKQIFSTVCAACHQPSGLGQEGLAPPLVDSEWVLGPDRRPMRILIDGLTGPIKVDGVDYSLEMPALPTLSDEDVADALT